MKETVILDRADFGLEPHQGLIVDTCDGEHFGACHSLDSNVQLKKDRAVCIGGYTYMLIDRREP